MMSNTRAFVLYSYEYSTLTTEYSYLYPVKFSFLRLFIPGCAMHPSNLTRGYVGRNTGYVTTRAS